MYVYMLCTYVLIASEPQFELRGHIEFYHVSIRFYLVGSSSVENAPLMLTVFLRVSVVP